MLKRVMTKEHGQVTVSDNGTVHGRDGRFLDHVSNLGVGREPLPTLNLDTIPTLPEHVGATVLVNRYAWVQVEPDVWVLRDGVHTVPESGAQLLGRLVRTGSELVVLNDSPDTVDEFRQAQLRLRPASSARPGRRVREVPDWVRAPVTGVAQPTSPWAEPVHRRQEPEPDWAEDAIIRRPADDPRSPWSAPVTTVDLSPGT